MKKAFITIVIGLLLLTGTTHAQENCRWTMAFWNVENYFDTWHDTLKDDCAFTPEGDNHWSSSRFTNKKNNLFKMIAAMKWPAVIGLAEVENDYVLRELCHGTPLRKLGYDFVHYESPDTRGIDCALLYRHERFQVLESRNINVSDSSRGLFTRDILLVGGVLKDSLWGSDTCFVLVNHWPSKRGGVEAERHRMVIAQLLLHTMDSLQQHHPSALVIAMGDFNATSDEEAISNGMGFHGKAVNGAGFYDLVLQQPKGTGSYKYQGVWSWIDHAIANRELKLDLFDPDFILVDDEKYMGKKPFRTYTGMHYQGGYSDHLPIMVTIP
ncbi:MAG: endonuclease/exonuclease/phosphatase family protein [Bacteroidales bacterium]|nr:endonuclease/exonuclease/phosphatase family protein [Bacteroidales bacterium]